MSSPEHRDGSQPLTELAKGLRKRTWVTAKLTAKTGLHALSRQLLPSTEKSYDEESSRRSIEAATKLVEQLDNLKGLLMKVGQMASYLDPSLPPEARSILAKLQAGSRPLVFEAVDAVFEEEFGASAIDLYDEFDREPFAAASIGQVHRARLGGRDLAVKIQYPGIRDAISSDLNTIGTLARFGSFGAALDTKEIVAELRERLLQECDYEAESRFQGIFQQLLSSWPQASVPDVMAERSTGKILSSSYSDRMAFESFTQCADQDTKNRAAALIFDVFMSTILRHSIYNADPHPGNYLFTEEGGVTFLDFGCVYIFSTETIEVWKRLAISVRAGDQKAFREATLATGQIVKTKGFDWDHHWKVLEYIYEPFMTPNFTFTHDYVRRSYEVLVWKNPNTRLMTFPREWLWVNRLQWGLNSVLAALNATGNWDELWWDAIESPTTAFDLELLAI